MAGRQVGQHSVRMPHSYNLRETKQRYLYAQLAEMKSELKKEIDIIQFGQEQVRDSTKSWSEATNEEDKKVYGFIRQCSVILHNQAVMRSIRLKVDIKRFQNALRGD